MPPYRTSFSSGWETNWGLLTRAYGFEFPEDVRALWELARDLAPDAPRDLLRPLGLILKGPFDLLAEPGDFPTGDAWRHDRAVLSPEPAELFVLLQGAPLGGPSRPGLRRWGYYLDDPERAVGFVGSRSTHDVSAVIADVRLLGAVRGMVERLQRDLEWIDDLVQSGQKATMLPPPGNSAARTWEPDSVPRQLERLFVLHDALVRYGAPEPEQNPRARRERSVSASTADSWGIVVNPGAYRPPTTDATALGHESIWARLFRGDTAPLRNAFEEAEQALRDGVPGTALKVAKDVAHKLDTSHPEVKARSGPGTIPRCFDLAARAYEAMDRPVLSRITRWQSALVRERRHLSPAPSPERDDFILPPRL